MLALREVLILYQSTEHANSLSVVSYPTVGFFSLLDLNVILCDMGDADMR